MPRHPVVEHDQQFARNLSVNLGSHVRVIPVIGQRVDRPCPDRSLRSITIPACPSFDLPQRLGRQGLSVRRTARFGPTKERQGQSTAWSKASDVARVTEVRASTELR